MTLFYLILCGLLSIALFVAGTQIAGLRRRLRETQGERDDYQAAWKQLEHRRIKSNLQLRCNGRDVPIYLPVATIVADGFQTIDEYQILGPDGAVVKTEKAAHPVKVCAGEDMTFIFNVAVEVTK